MIILDECGIQSKYFKMANRSEEVIYGYQLKAEVYLISHNYGKI